MRPLILFFSFFMSLANYPVQAFAQTRKPVCISRQELTARSLGVVSKFHVADGDTVKKGELLLELDSRALKAGIKEASGAVDAAQAQVDLARDASTRLEKLKGSDAVAEQQVAEAVLRLAQARAVARQAQGALERLKVQWEDTQIRAEISGTLRGLPSILGLAVQPGQSLGRIEAPANTCR
jgi:RND family efflux transporter MFP subunit